MDDPNYDYCPFCDGDIVLLGVLGHVVHFRCRDCGLDFSREYTTRFTGEEA